MKLNIPTDDRMPRPAEAELSHGGRVLTVTVERPKRKPLTTVYLVEQAGGLVRLIRDDGTVCTVSPHGCDCPDMQFRGRDWICKHRVALGEVGLLESISEEA